MNLDEIDYYKEMAKEKTPEDIEEANKEIDENLEDEVMTEPQNDLE